MGIESVLEDASDNVIQSIYIINLNFMNFQTILDLAEGDLRDLPCGVSGISVVQRRILTGIIRKLKYFLSKLQQNVSKIYARKMFGKKPNSRILKNKTNFITFHSQNII